MAALALLGRQVADLSELAKACQVFRNPQFETFRVIFQRDGYVVGQCGVSARLPGSTQWPDGFEAYIDEQASRLKADSLWLVHNHPSGDPTPSPADKAATEALAASNPLVAGHIIINSGKYSAWKRGSGWAENVRLPLLGAEQDYGWGSFEMSAMSEAGSDIYLQKVDDAVRHIAKLLKKNQSPAGRRAVIAAMTKGQVIRGLVDVSSDALTNPLTSSGASPAVGYENQDLRRQWVRRMAIVRLLGIQLGANQGIAMFCSPEHFDGLLWLHRDGIVRHLIAIDDAGEALRNADDEPPLPAGHQPSMWFEPVVGKVVEKYFADWGYGLS